MPILQISYDAFYMVRNQSISNHIVFPSKGGVYEIIFK